MTNELHSLFDIVLAKASKPFNDNAAKLNQKISELGDTKTALTRERHNLVESQATVDLDLSRLDEIDARMARIDVHQQALMDGAVAVRKQVDVRASIRSNLSRLMKAGEAIINHATRINDRIRCGDAPTHATLIQLQGQVGNIREHADDILEACEQYGMVSKQLTVAVNDYVTTVEVAVLNIGKEAA